MRIMKYILRKDKRSPDEFYHSCEEFPNYNKIAYQYTKLHSIDDILRSGCLFATDVNFLNDSEEYKFAYNVLKNDDKTIEDDYRFFSVSFTEKKDDVPQYMIYAGEIGVSIGYDFSFNDWGTWADFIESSKNFDIATEAPKLACYTTSNKIFCFNIQLPKQILYLNHDNCKETVKIIVDKLQDQIKEGDKSSKAQCFLPCFIKNDAFSSEKEIRFAVAAMEISSEKSCIYHTKIGHYKANNNILKPYISLFYSDGEQNIGLPIKEIWVGPGRNQDRAFESVKMRLETDIIKVFPLPITEFLVRLIKYYEEMTIYINKIYDKNIMNFSNFIKFALNINGVEGYAAKLRNIKEYKLLDEKGTIELFDKQNKKYCLCYGEQVYNSDSYWKAQEIFLDIEIRYKTLLAKAIEEIEIERINSIIESQERFNGKIKEDYLNMKAEDLINDYKNIHYFSYKGISVYKSKKGIAN